MITNRYLASSPTRVPARCTPSLAAPAIIPIAPPSLTPVSPLCSLQPHAFFFNPGGSLCSALISVSVITFYNRGGWPEFSVFLFSISSKIIDKHMKRAKSLTEGALEREESRARRRRAVVPVEVADWQLVDTCAAHRWIIKEPPYPFPGAVLTGFARNPTITTIFLTLFNDALVGSLGSALGMPLDMKRFLEVTALRILLQFVIPPPRRSACAHPLQTSFENARQELADQKIETISWMTWNRDFNRICVPVDWCRSYLTCALEGLIQYGSYITLDEKLRRYTGSSPCARTILRKQDQVGH